MKIAFFNYMVLEYGGGVAKYFIETSTGLKKRYKNLSIDIVTFNESTLKMILFIYWLYFFGGQDRNFKNKEKEDEIKKKLNGVNYIKVGLSNLKSVLKQYDLIYTTNNFLEVMLFKYFVGYQNISKVIFGFHIPSYYPLSDSYKTGLHNLIYSCAVYKNALKQASALHVMNNFDEKNCMTKLPKSNVVKIYYPFDFDKFVRKSYMYKINFKFSKQKLNILWIGRLTEQKGVRDLIKIIENINLTIYRDKIRWNIIGMGEFKNYIENLAKREKNVKYYGYVQNNFIPSFINKCDLFISTSKWESFPYNLIEAQSFGLPAISYNIHGCNDIIENGKNGLLVDDAVGFEKKITEILEKPYFKRSSIKSYIRKKFDKEKIYRQMCNLFINA